MYKTPKAIPCSKIITAVMVLRYAKVDKYKPGFLLAFLSVPHFIHLLLWFIDCFQFFISETIHECPFKRFKKNISEAKTYYIDLAGLKLADGLRLLVRIMLTFVYICKCLPG